MKSFLITIDAEGDNLWEWNEGCPISTENSAYLQRFQDLCNGFGYKPVWLSNYEMISDSRYVDFISESAELGNCEIGMHLHAWNTPPLVPLEGPLPGAPYLIEYEDAVMFDKLRTMTELIEARTGAVPVSHRAGRWATNQKYFDMLLQLGYRADCSATPHVNWRRTRGRTKGSHGSDYSRTSEKAYLLSHTGADALIEIPMSVRNQRVYEKPSSCSVAGIGRTVKRALVGKKIWLRPNGINRNELIRLINEISAEPGNDYIMFMLHSSELMPGGSPGFRNADDINRLYRDMEAVFQCAGQYYTGETMKAYAERFLSDHQGIG